MELPYSPTGRISANHTNICLHIHMAPCVQHACTCRTVHICIHTPVYLYIYIHMYVHTYIHTCIHTCTDAYTPAYVYVCIMASIGSYHRHYSMPCEYRCRFEVFFGLCRQNPAHFVLHRPTPMRFNTPKDFGIAS